MMSRTWLLLLFAGASLAMYPEQLRFNWKQENYGVPTFVGFHQRNAIVATDAQVVAALALKNGAISWRRTLPAPVIALEVSEFDVVTLSENGQLFSWNPIDGELQWDLSLSELNPTGPSEVKSLTAWSRSAAIGLEVYVVISSTLFGIRKGEVRWVWSPSSEGASIEGVAIVGDKAIALVLNTDNTLERIDLAAIWASARELPALSEVVPTASTQPPRFVFTSDHQFAVRSVPSGVEVLALGSDSFTPTISSFQSIGVSADLVVDTTVRLNNAFVLTSPQESQIIYISEDGSLRAGQEIQGTFHSLVTSVSTEKLPNTAAASTVQSASGTIVTITFEGGRTSVATVPNARISKACVQEFQKKSAVAHRLIAVTTSGQVLAFTVQPNQLVPLWSSEQALSDVVSARIVVLPGDFDESASTTATVSGVREGPDTIHFVRPTLLSDALLFVDYLKNKFQNIVLYGVDNAEHIFTELTDRFGRVLTDGPAALLASSELPVRTDIRGVVCFATRGGHTYGLSLAEGRLVWQRPSSHGAGVWGSQAFKQSRVFLFETRKAGILTPRTALVIIDNAGAQIEWFDPITGQDVVVHRVPGSWAEAVTLPATILDKHSSLYIALISVDGTTTVVGIDGLLARSDVPPLHHYRVLPSESQSVGYRYDKATGTLQPSWVIRFGANERVAKTFRRTRSTKLSSAVLVMPDRSVLHKYLNPNMFIVATESTDPAVGVSLYLIDAVSGHLLHHSTHAQCSGPVNIAVADNDVFVSVWNRLSRQNQLVVLELSESRASDSVLDLVFGSLGVPVGHLNRSHYSAFARPAPQVKLQQYFIPSPVKTLAVTETADGITSKQLLVGLATGQVFALDRRFVNPRNLFGNPSEAEREDGLLPYRMIVPLNTHMVVSRNTSIEGLELIETEAANFESESHMIAVGLDILYAPLTPSGLFDRLSADFNKPAVFLSLFGLTVGLVALATAAAHQDLSTAWR